MSIKALAKALGIWLGIAAVVAVWIGGMAWATVTNQGGWVQILVSLWPALIFAGVFVTFVPIASMYTHFKSKEDKR